MFIWGLLIASQSIACVHIRPDSSTNSKVRVIWKVDFKFMDAKGKVLKKSHLSSSTLLSAMASKETSGSLAITRLALTGKYKLYKRSVVYADVRRLKKLYRYHGFYEPQIFFDEHTDVKVLADINSYRKFERIRLTIRIVEGRRVKITKMTYRWPERYVWLPPNVRGRREAGLAVGVLRWRTGKPVQKELKGVLKKPLIQVGSPFSTPKYKLWKGLLLKRLQDRSFALAAVRGRVIINKESHEATIEMTVIPLVLCRFGRLKIINNKRVHSSLIRRVMKFKENQGQYTIQKLVHTQRALFGLGLFRTVSVKPDLVCAKARLVKRLGGRLSEKQRQEIGDCMKGWSHVGRKEKPLIIPIVVDAQEDKFQLFKLGVGLVIDGQRNQGGVSVGWNFMHFLGGLRQLKLQFNPSWAFLPDIIRRFDNGPEITGSITFKQPVFMDRQAELGMRVLYRRTEEIGDADYQSLTPSIWFSRPLFGRLTGRISFNVELSFGVQNPLSLERENYQLAYFEQQLVLDLRDDPLNTTKGLFLSLTMLQAPFGTFQFIKIAPEARFFVPLPFGAVLAGRFMYGIMWSQRTGDTGCSAKGTCVRTVSEVLRQSPLTQRFFSGGANSVRGWTARYLGPLACRIQKQKHEFVSSSETIQTRQGKSVTAVRVVRQVRQTTESVPDPVNPNAASQSNRQRQLHPLLKRGVTCRPAQVQVMQQRSRDIASRRDGLPLDGRPGRISLPQQPSLQVVPTGGHHLLEGSLELRVPLSFVSKKLGVVLFVDAGVIQLEPQIEVLDELIPSVSVGGGIRFRTPVGALRLDIAGRVTPDDDRYPLQPHWQVHFSFGEAF